MTGAGEVLRVRAPAKVNLLLRVAGKRPDGYHELESVMSVLDLADTVELKRRSGAGIELALDAPGIPPGPGNLAWRAAELFFRETGASGGVEISLTKRIPAGGGLGGGSSDAVAVLRGLNELFGTGLDLSALESLAARLGSDTAFFVRGGTSLCRGRGEIVEPLPPPPPLFLVLLLPPFPCPTGRVYRFFREEDSSSPEIFEDALERMNRAEGNPMEWIRNDLEAAARRAVPELDRLLEDVRAAGLEGFRVSGSGSTLFRAFFREEEARRVLERDRALLGRRGVEVVPARAGREEER